MHRSASLLSDSLSRLHRSKFQEHGFAVVDGFLNGIAVSTLRSAVKRGVQDRADDFLGCPRAIDVFKQESQAHPDPTYAKFVEKFKEVSRRKAAMRKHKRALRKQNLKLQEDPIRQANLASPLPSKPVREATRDDVWELSRRIAAQLVKTPAEVSTIYNDPARLKAINRHKCNVWMTNEELKRQYFGDIGKAIGQLAQSVCGLREPVLFADRPFVRETYYKPTLLHCGAPFFGVYRHDVGNASEPDEPLRPTTCVVWLFFDDSSALRSPLWVLEGSHRVVRTAISKGVRGGVDVRRLTNLYPPVDSDLSLWLQHFSELFKGNGQATEMHLRAGSALVMDSHLLASLGPNLGSPPHVSLQCLVASAADAKPSVHPVSWVRDWKSNSRSIDFRNPVVFPRLF